MDPVAGVVGIRLVDFLSAYRRTRTEGRHQFGLIGCAFGRDNGRCRVVTLEKRENALRAFACLSFREFGCHP